MEKKNLGPSLGGERRVVGIIPARMAASRFPGKPLALLGNKPMLRHVYDRASKFVGWDDLVVSTCDQEISEYCRINSIPCLMSSDEHTRALDRVRESAADLRCSDDDIVVCVQGDEPTLLPSMIEAVVTPLQDERAKATLLAIEIDSELQWLNPDTVKLVVNQFSEVIYTSRAPIPYSSKGFSAELNCLRVGGIFGFYTKYLNEFSDAPEGRLEYLEACDSNRILDFEWRQFACVFPAGPFVSVDSPSDLDLAAKVLT